MSGLLKKLTLDEWEVRHAALARTGLPEPAYGGPLQRHVAQRGNRRLQHLRFDPSPAALRLWNFLLTENDRLHLARARGDRLVGAMKDLGTVPVMACALPALRAFYPDGAWWTPCLMECSDALLDRADSLGIDATFCPVRALLGAFITRDQFPIPDLLTCSSGAVCDDFSAIAQRLERLGHPILWWEIPRRRPPDPGEPACPLPGNLSAPLCQVEVVRDELLRVGRALEELARHPLDAATLGRGLSAANRIRDCLRELRHLVYSAPAPPLPALEMLVAEMLALHFCSDRDETRVVLEALLAEARFRLCHGQAVLEPAAVRVFWVNPVADLRAMNLIEDRGGRLCGTDFMFAHALDRIPEHLPPIDALARTALADPMVGSTHDRARRIVAECRQQHAEAVVISRIPGASHCAREGALIRNAVHDHLELPTLELEFPSLADPLEPALTNRLDALLEIARSRRQP